MKLTSIYGGRAIDARFSEDPNTPEKELNTKRRYCNRSTLLQMHQRWTAEVRAHAVTKSILEDLVQEKGLKWNADILAARTEIHAFISRQHARYCDHCTVNYRAKPTRALALERKGKTCPTVALINLLAGES